MSKLTPSVDARLREIASLMREEIRGMYEASRVGVSKRVYLINIFSTRGNINVEVKCTTRGIFQVNVSKGSPRLPVEQLVFNEKSSFESIAKRAVKEFIQIYE